MQMQNVSHNQGVKFREQELQKQIEELSSHPLYSAIKCLDSLHIFMKYHVLAVWDFMSLLKSLQNQITCTQLPWHPTAYPKELVRMINEIVLGEESDLDQDGQACDHFTLYLKAMNEVGAKTTQIDSIISKCQQVEQLDRQVMTDLTSELKGAAKNFVYTNLELAAFAPVHQVAAAFFYGREKAIPTMFESIIVDLKRSGIKCDTLIYYLDRHIELDGDEHGQLAGACLEILCGDDQKKWSEAYQVAEKSLQKRRSLWDQALNEISQN